MPPFTDDQILTLTQAANALGCSRSAIHKAAQNGSLPVEVHQTAVGIYYLVKFGDAKVWWTRPRHKGGRPPKKKVNGTP